MGWLGTRVWNKGLLTVIDVLVVILPFLRQRLPATRRCRSPSFLFCFWHDLFSYRFWEIITREKSTGNVTESIHSKVSDIVSIAPFFLSPFK